MQRKHYIEGQAQMSVEEKEIVGKQDALALTYALNEGMHIDLEKRQETEADQALQELAEKQKKQKIKLKAGHELCICDQVDKIVEQRKALGHFETGIQGFRTKTKRFAYWLKLTQGSDQISAKEITVDLVKDYSQWILVDQGLKGKTHNNYTTTAHTFWNNCQDNGWILKSEENPFATIPKAFEGTDTVHRSYTSEEVALIKRTAIASDPYLWLFLQFVHYLCMRPVEIRRLKVSQLNLDTETITIFNSGAKNKKKAVLRIHKDLVENLKARGVMNYEPDMFLFGRPESRHNMTEHPRYIPVSHCNFAQRFTRLKKRIEANPNEPMKLKPDDVGYSMKHTMVTLWWHNMTTKDIRKIQKMCRHSSVLQTEKYLRELGIVTEERTIEDMPTA